MSLSVKMSLKFHLITQLFFLDFLWNSFICQEGGIRIFAAFIIIFLPQILHSKIKAKVLSDILESLKIEFILCLYIQVSESSIFVTLIIMKIESQLWGAALKCIWNEILALRFFKVL